MHFTLHLTSDCNLRCKYCYTPPIKSKEMSSEVSKRSIDFITKTSPENAGVIFFGGEPLLKKDLIIQTVEYAKSLEKKGKAKFHYKVTTNGLLLDEEFLEYSLKNSIYMGISIDGIKEAHDYHRKNAKGKGSFDRVIQKAKLLLQYQPYSNVLMVVSPETVEYFYDSVVFLLDFGFKYIISSLNYAGNWNDEKLNILKKQYKKISKLYEKLTLKEHKFYFSPFEKKLASHIMGNKYKDYECHFGVRQISISPNGDIFPWVQFVKYDGSTESYKIGDIRKGIDHKKQSYLYRKSRNLQDICKNCALRERCDNKCACIKFQTTGEIDKVSPILCGHERMIIPIVDKLGEKLYKKGSSVFMQKHYNNYYPLISFFQDMEEEIILRTKDLIMKKNGGKNET